MVSQDSSEQDVVAALRALPREVAPPTLVEGRVLSALRARGLLRAAPVLSRRAAFMAVAASATMAFLGGYALRPAATHLEPTHMLLLVGAPTRELEHAERAREYGDWARRPHPAGAVVSGNAFEQTSAAGEVVGYFLVRAASTDDATALAKTCPHWRHGGRVVVRAIQPG